MGNIIEQLQFSASITGPICLMLALGVILKRTNAINENFIDVASKLVFNVTLPALLLLGILKSNHDVSSSAALVSFGVIANFSFFLLSIFVTRRYFSDPRDKGVIIQGGFRANTAIIGLAYVSNAYGESGVAMAAVYVASMTLLYNIQAVICLTPKGEQSGRQALGVIIKTLTKNPLIIAIILGIVISLLAIPIPKMVTDAGQYFANMTLPLALLCTGGSLDIGSLKHERYATWFASFLKLVAAPLLITIAAMIIGFRGIDLAIVFLMSSAPTAAASYVMARAMGGNATLAANIIALTTVCSLLTCTLGIFLLSTFQFI
ncbi:AEC family transporter [Shewanella acanthi]|uniref:AEC family transporter n=1 Tax=Shewanella acanthi TaxID=2864212 RepID=UPI001C65BD41|nr:AEC family transporter [Shewanella acanthi]QYJ80236.1 AEC family transporter [Shewanella acanthi]